MLNKNRTLAYSSVTLFPELDIQPFSNVLFDMTYIRIHMTQCAVVESRVIIISTRVWLIHFILLLLLCGGVMCNVRSNFWFDAAKCHWLVPRVCRMPTTSHFQLTNSFGMCVNLCPSNQSLNGDHRWYCCITRCRYVVITNNNQTKSKHKTLREKWIIISRRAHRMELS